MDSVSVSCLGGNPLALSRVDVLESDIESLFGLIGTDILRDLPRSKSDLEDLTPVVQGDVLEGHFECSSSDESLTKR